jgi:hypothetical protein
VTTTLLTLLALPLRVAQLERGPHTLPKQTCTDDDNSLVSLDSSIKSSNITFNVTFRSVATRKRITTSQNVSHPAMPSNSNE